MKVWKGREDMGRRRNQKSKVEMSFWESRVGFVH